MRASRTNTAFILIVLRNRLKIKYYGISSKVMYLYAICTSRRASVSVLIKQNSSLYKLSNAVRIHKLVLFGCSIIVCMCRAPIRVMVTSYEFCCIKRHNTLSLIWDTHGGECEDGCLLGCSAECRLVWVYRRFRGQRRYIPEDIHLH
jgi:hypothetical protein